MLNKTPIKWYKRNKDMWAWLWLPYQNNLHTTQLHYLSHSLSQSPDRHGNNSIRNNIGFHPHSYPCEPSLHNPRWISYIMYNSGISQTSFHASPDTNYTYLRKCFGVVRLNFFFGVQLIFLIVFNYLVGDY